MNSLEIILDSQISTRMPQIFSMMFLKAGMGVWGWIRQKTESRRTFLLLSLCWAHQLAPPSWMTGGRSAAKHHGKIRKPLQDVQIIYLRCQGKRAHSGRESQRNIGVAFFDHPMPCPHIFSQQLLLSATSEKCGKPP